jgi:hypothetical protein
MHASLSLHFIILKTAVFPYPENNPYLHLHTTVTNLHVVTLEDGQVMPETCGDIEDN